MVGVSLISVGHTVNEKLGKARSTLKRMLVSNQFLPCHPEVPLEKGQSAQSGAVALPPIERPNSLHVCSVACCLVVLRQISMAILKKITINHIFSLFIQNLINLLICNTPTGCLENVLLQGLFLKVFQLPSSNAS